MSKNVRAGAVSLDLAKTALFSCWITFISLAAHFIFLSLLLRVTPADFHKYINNIEHL
jgi:hypothetical protein